MCNNARSRTFEGVVRIGKRAGKMTDEETDKIIELVLADPTAGLKAYNALTVEERKQVLEKAQDERINQIVAEADAESITD